MKSSKLVFICFAVATWACGSTSTEPPMSSGTGGASGQPGSGSSGSVDSDASIGDPGASGSGGSASGAGGATGAGGGGTDDASSGSSGSAGSASNFDGGVNIIPAGYTGTPFVENVIPGFIYTANYDKGGPGVAYCHSATATTPTTCANGIKLSDWCCSNSNAQMTGARCDQRNMAKGPCPLYRPDNDNAGLSHMNLGEVDTTRLPVQPGWRGPMAQR